MDDKPKGINWGKLLPFLGGWFGIGVIVAGFWGGLFWFTW